MIANPPEKQRDDEAHRRPAPGLVGDDLEGAHDGLDLQADVGDDANDGNRRNQRREQQGLAVAKAEEVRDRGDAIGLGDAHDPGEHHHREGGHQGRPEVDRQEGEPRGGGAADAPVKGPRGAVHGEREGVDVGVVDKAAPASLLALGDPGDAEQQQQVAQQDEEDVVGGEHRVSTGR